jgi:prepilin-type N-terminal cleavage/methylation domain-containing protein
MIMRKRSGKSGQKRHGGFTLAEVLLSVVITGIVLSAAAALAYAVGKAWSQSENINEVVSSGRLATVRITDRIRTARAIGYADDQVLVIWREDSNGDGAVNLSELTLFEFDPDDGELREGQLVFPAGTSQATRDANNWEVATGDFTREWIGIQMKLNDYYTQGVISEHVTQMAWITDVDPPDTRMVQHRMTLSKDGRSQAIHGGSALRLPIKLE